MELPRHNITIRFKSNGVKEEAKDITFDNENEFLFNFVKENFIDVKNFSLNLLILFCYSNFFKILITTSIFYIIVFYF